MSAPRVLTIAGVDPCGGAGLVADVLTITSLGGDPCAVPSCVTDQDRSGFRAAHAIPPGPLAAMLDSVARDGAIAAIKVGMLADPATVAAIAKFVDALPDDPPLVVDPVLSATAGGGPKAAREVVAALVDTLVPRATLLTPNLDELAAIAGDGGAQALLADGAEHVLVTGGDAEPAGDSVIDRLIGRDGVVELRHPRVDVGPVHGTGCALSSAIAVRLAFGDELATACRTAVAHLVERLRSTARSTDGRPVPLAH